MNGWIKLYRKFEESKFGADIEIIGLFPALLLMANHKDGFTKDGTLIKAGQLMTSQLALAKRFMLSETKVRRMLTKLKTAGQIDVQATKKNSIITIVNWGKYQGSDEDNGEQAADTRRTEKEQKKTNKNVNNNKNDKNINTDAKKNLSKAQPKANLKLEKSPLSFLFKEDDEIQQWLIGEGASENVQKELLDNYSHHVLAEEVKTAFQWQCEREPRNAGLFLKNWLKNKPKKQAYGRPDPLEELLIEHGILASSGESA